MIIQLYLIAAYGIEAYFIIYVYSLNVSILDLYFMYGYTLITGIILIMLWFLNESRIIIKNKDKKEQVR